MTSSKISITIDPLVEERARQDVAAGKAASVSAWLNEAGRERLERDELGEVLAEIFASTGGVPTEEERAEARRLLGASSP